MSIQTLAGRFFSHTSNTDKRVLQIGIIEQYITFGVKVKVLYSTEYNIVEIS